MIYTVENNKVVEFNNQYVEYFYSRYVPDNSLICLSAINFSKLSIPPNVRNIILDSGNPIAIDQLLATKDSVHYSTILTGLFNYYKTPHPNPKVQFFPFWVLWMNNPHAPAMPMGQHEFSNKAKKYKVSCLNGTQWAHRKFTYLKFSQRPYFKDSVFTFKQRDHYGSLPCELTLTDEELVEFNQLPQTVDFLSNDSDIGIDLSVMHPAYQETYINLVTETTTNFDTPMLSEKTLKPIVAGQLFILIASPNAVQFLRDIGIDTFDDIIDHSYDTKTNIRQRILLALDQVDQLVQMDLSSLYEKIKPRLQRNSQYVLSKEFCDQFKLHFE